MRRIAVWLAAFSVAVSAQATALPENKIVRADWLAENLDAEGLRIIDIRDGIIPYWQGHLPGAVYLNPEALRFAENGVPVMLLSPETLTDRLGKLGVTPETAIVVYTETGDYKAPFLIWALDYIGHEKSAVLEGGYGKWVAEGHPVTQDYPTVTPTRYPTPEAMRPEVRALLPQVREILNAGTHALLDVRATDLYVGERNFWKRPGHIPGFKGRFWGDDLKPDGTWKNPDDLRQAYAALGATAEKPILVMCGQGLMSAHAYFTLKYVLGYRDVRNYDGGYHEWVAHDDLPVTTGSE